MVRKNDLVDHISLKLDVSRKQAGEMVDAIFDSIATRLASGERVQIPGFGTFSVATRKEHQGVNPQTQEPMTVPASKSVRFKATHSTGDDGEYDGEYD